MNTQNQDQTKTEETFSPLVSEHVHGPHCNHHHSVAPVIRQTPKVGRNDDCPCGSKNKFKKCCGK